MTTPLIRCIKNDTQANLHFLTKQKYTDLIRHNPYLNKIHIWEEQADIISTLKKEQFDLIIDFHNTIKSRRISRELKTKVIKTDKMPIRKWLMLFGKINLLNNSQVVVRHFECVKNLGVKNDGLGMEIFPEKDPNDIILEKKIIINAGGSTVTKRIPVKVINDLNNKSSYHFDIIGGSDVSYLSNKLRLNENSTDSINQRTLLDNIIAIKNCPLIITGDTGCMHIAAAFHKPMIVIWGSTSSEFGFYPYYGKQKDQSIHVQNDLKCRPCSKYGKNQCPKGHMDCLNKISTNEVIQHINRIMAANYAHGNTVS